MRLGIVLLLMIISIIGLIIPLYELFDSGVLQGLMVQYGTSMLVVYALGVCYFAILNILPLRYRPKALLNALSLLLIVLLVALQVIEQLHWIFALGAVVITFIGWRLLAIARLLRGYFKAMSEYEDLGDLELLNQALLRVSQQKCAQSLWINVSGYIITFRAFLHLVVPFKLAFDGDNLNLLRLQQQAKELAARNRLSTLGDQRYMQWAEQSKDDDFYDAGAAASRGLTGQGIISDASLGSSKVRDDDHLEHDYLHLLNNMVKATTWFNRQKQRAAGSAGVGVWSATANAGARAGHDPRDPSSVDTQYGDEQHLDREIDSRLAAFGQKVTASDKLQLKLVVKMLWAFSADNPRVQKSAAPVKQRRLVDFELGSAVMSFQGMWHLGHVRHNLSVLWPLLCMVLSLFSLWALLRPENVNAFFVFKGAFTDSFSLLEAYNLWFLLLILVLAGGLMLMLSGLLLVGLDVSRYFAALKMQVILCAFYIFLVVSLLVGGNVISLFYQVHSDLLQAQKGINALQRSEVFLSPKVLITNLGEPLSKFQSVRRFHGFSTQDDDEDDYYLVPRDVWLPWDQLHVYQEDRSHSWNYEHACHYLLYHTSNLNLVLFAQQIQFDHREQVSLENQAVPLRDSFIEPSHISRRTLDDLIDALRQNDKDQEPQVPIERTKDNQKGAPERFANVSQIKHPTQARDYRPDPAPAGATAPVDAAAPAGAGAPAGTGASAPAPYGADAEDGAVDDEAEQIILPSLQDRYRGHGPEEQDQSQAARALDQAYHQAQQTNLSRERNYEAQNRKALAQDSAP